MTKIKQYASHTVSPNNWSSVIVFLFSISAILTQLNIKGK